MKERMALMGWAKFFENAQADCIKGRVAPLSEGRVEPLDLDGLPGFLVIARCSPMVKP
jgi:hypothetical protein